MKRSLLALPIVFNLIIGVSAQNPATSSSPQPQQPDPDTVVRITSNLVQIDAVVTDSNGRLVTDLRPEEIEVREDDRLQKITNFSFVAVAPTTVSSEKPGPVDRSAPPVTAVPLNREQVQRTIALVVDDLGISFESIGFVQKALRKFVDQQMQPGDLVAIIRTSAGIGALQQFTSDKRVLYAAIERVRWNARGRGGLSPFNATEADPRSMVPADTHIGGPPPQEPTHDSGSSQFGKESVVDVSDLHVEDDLTEFRNATLTVGTLGAVDYVVRGLRELPGRKSVLLITDGLTLFGYDPHRDNGRDHLLMKERLRRLADLANRSSVIIYAIDSRGVQPFALPPDDLSYLPDQTGGFTVKNRNDLGAGIKQVLDDQRGYYLIGYRPDDSTFDPGTGRRIYHTMTVKVKGRPGLKVRYRNGFYGITDKELQPDLRTRAQQLIKALTSPFASAGVKLQLTSLFGNDRQVGSFVLSLLYIYGQDLTFTDEAEGWHKAVFDVLAVTFGDDGRIVDQISKTHTLRVRGDVYERVRKSGLDYPIILPIKKAGAYQLRTAIRDAASERVGSASQFINVPNISKNRLTLSGLVLSGIDPAHASSSLPESATTNGSTPSISRLGSGAGDTYDQFDPQASAAVRRFRQGMMLRYSFEAYNAKLTNGAMVPQLHVQVRLFREGKPVFTGKVQTIDFQNQEDLKRLAAGGILRLGTDLGPGEYILQVTVIDPSAKEKYRRATQWMDFEIIK
ncbi:MAG TPA: VWA domain-containing protein [Pyrinomonadaceae bacterium]|nr:VWA domain-containing protein [Pyrinomonadaceae bacterium]